jgi:phosphate starvation-inducible PhoH-like protein
MIPRNTAQESYVSQLLDENNRIVIASGSAGTGKTYLATMAAIKSLREGATKRIVITRPMVEVENEKIGFLPGGLQEKMDPWLRPIFDIFEEFFSKQDITNMIEVGTIEICPLAFMRGRSLKDCFIILDESQNCTPKQILMVSTRLDRNTRMVITGDTRQTDRKGDQNGLVDIIARIKANPKFGIAYTIFDKRHVERDEIVQTVLELYDEE